MKAQTKLKQRQRNVKQN